MEYFSAIGPISGDEPRIAMDVRHYSMVPDGMVLDVDPAGVQATADQLAGRPVDLSNLTLSVQQEHSSVSSYITTGSSTEVKIISRLDSLSPKNVTYQDKNIRHELRHLIDDQDGRLRRSRLGALAYHYASEISELKMNFLPRMAESAALVTAPLADRWQSPSSMLIEFGAGALLGTLATAGMLTYALDPKELRAQKAERQTTPPMVSLRPDPNSQRMESRRPADHLTMDTNEAKVVVLSPTPSKARRAAGLARTILVPFNFSSKPNLDEPQQRWYH